MSQPTRRFFRFAVPGASWLDLKLALRMLFKQPGLTLVAIFAIAIGIPVGLLPLHVLSSLTRPLPVENGQEIVMVRNYDRAKSSPVMRPLHDFVQWRWPLTVGAIALFVMAVGMLACVKPTLRAIRIRPVEALRV